MILVTYPTDESITSANRYIEWSMDNTNWNVLREMMVLTGEDNLVYIRNTRGFSVRLEILATK
jgi:hypothetical protein